MCGSYCPLTDRVIRIPGPGRVDPILRIQQWFRYWLGGVGRGFSRTTLTVWGDRSLLAKAPTHCKGNSRGKTLVEIQLSAFGKLCLSAKLGCQQIVSLFAERNRRESSRLPDLEECCADRQGAGAGLPLG